MPVYSRQQLSGSSNGLPINISATNAAGAQVIHQVQATSTAAFESLWLSSKFLTSGDAVLVLLVETATATESINTLHGPAGTQTTSLYLLEGLLMTGTDTRVLAYGATTGAVNSFSVNGYVNRIATG